MTAKNVVLVVLDTVRAEYVDTTSADTHTPTLAQLAERGTTYTNAYASAPWTLPSHASLFTGTYPSKHGAHADHKRLEGELLTLPSVFFDAGYETVAVSNNTWISEEFGFGHGFETFYKTWQLVQSNIDLGHVARTSEGPEKFKHLGRTLLDGNPLVNLINTIYGRFLRKRQDSGARRTNQWIEKWLGTRDKDRPFFLFVNYLEPHLEYRPPREFASRFLPDGVSYDAAMDVPQDAWEYITGQIELNDHDFEILRALYRAEIASLDQRLGELREHLVTAGEWEDTLLVVTSDHGENIGEHGLMDHQYCLYDTLLHVPLVVRGPSFTGGQAIDAPVQLVDLPATILDATDIKASQIRKQFQGTSFHPDAENDPREQVIAEYLAPQPSMDALEQRVGDLPEDVQRFDRSLRSIRVGEWKLIRGSDGSSELYHIGTDHAELTDLADTEPEKVTELGDVLDSWLDSFEHSTADGDVTMSQAARRRLDDLGYHQ